nr:glycosyltransferase [Priestia flexa]
MEKELDLIKTPPYIVVPNAIDETLIPLGNYEEKGQERDVVLCVGRIEPRKNQLNLVKAMQGLDINLILVGKVHSTQMNYFAKVKKIVDESPNIKIIDEIEHEQLFNLYKSAKVHVLPSWYDTPGLVSLEASVNGCNIVVTNRGTTEEYFESDAYYCEPDNIVSIKNAIVQAYNNPYNDNLKRKILKEYTWKNTAEKTIMAYNKLLLKD